MRMPCHVRTRIQTNALQCIGKTTAISIVINESAQCIQNLAFFQHSAMLYKYSNSYRLYEFYQLVTKVLRSSKKRKNCFAAG